MGAGPGKGDCVSVTIVLSAVVVETTDPLDAPENVEDDLGDLDVLDDDEELETDMVS